MIIPTPNPYDPGGQDLSKVRISVLGKMYFAYRISLDRKNAKVLAKLYSLKVDTLQRYYYNAKNGILMHERGGRPYVVSDEFSQVVVDKVTDQEVQISKEKFLDEISEAAKKTAEAQGKVVPEKVYVDRMTRIRWEKRKGILTGLAELTTDARMVATASIKNAITFAAMNYLMVVLKKTNPLLIINADSTQFTVGGSGDSKCEVKYADAPNAPRRNTGKRPLRALPKKGADNSLTKYFIKFLLLINAAGMQADPIYILADDNMKEDEFRHYEIENLGVGTQLGNKGHVLITKTRCGNTKLYAWFIEKFLVEFIKRIKATYNLPDDSEAWFQLDGEAVQIYPYFNERLFNMLKSNLAHVGKLPAATTSITQPCDVGNCFRGPKTGNKKIGKENVADNTFTLSKIEAKIREHNEWLNSDERSPEYRATGNKKKKLKKNEKENTIAFNQSHVSYAKYGLLRVQLAVQNCMKQSMIRESFLRCGIYPFSLERILSMFQKANTRMTPQEVLTIKRNLTSLAKILEEDGEIAEAKIDELNIKSADEPWRKGKNADNLVLWRRRAVLLTHQKVQDKERVNIPAHAILVDPPVEPGVPVVAALATMVPPIVPHAEPQSNDQVGNTGKKRRACAEPAAIKAKLNNPNRN